MINNINNFRELVDQDWEKYSHDHFRAPTALDTEVLIKTCLMPLAIKTQNDSFTFVHKLKQEMLADLKYVESLENEIDKLESDKADFKECVSNDVMCSYLHSLSDLDAHNELQCLYLHKVKECECLAQTLAKQTESIVQLILFIVDSGCTKHMTGNLKLLCNFVEKYLGTVRFGNDQFAPILGYRDLVQGNITINRVYYVEGLNHNLFSIGQFYDVELEVAFWNLRVSLEIFRETIYSPKEYRALCKEPVSHVVARPSPNDILEWRSQGTPFAGGYYYGKIKFPPEYPFKPPGIR
nr:ubiquitin-conjugating enzyme E2 34-like [Tanacetum cinerariifolium]